MSNNEFDFSDLKIIEIRGVKVFGNEYVMREASEAAASAYESAGIAAYRYDDDGNLEKIEGAADAESILLAGCLWEVKNGKETGRNPGLDFVRSWPRRVTGKLVEKVKEISNLAQGTIESLEADIAKLQERLARMKEQEEAGKNGGSDTETGCDTPEPTVSPSR